MKIDLATAHDYSYTEFKTEAEWKTYLSGFKPGMLYPRDQYPTSFPCLMVQSSGSHICNNDGPDEFVNFFFYAGQYEK